MKYFSFFVFFFAVFAQTITCKAQENNSFINIEEALKNKKEAYCLILINDSKYVTFPTEIYDLQMLNKLSFTGSECDTRNLKCKNITQIPNGLYRLFNLKELNLVMNNIKSITNEINTLKNLRSLDLSNNPNINVDNLNNPNLEVLNLNECNLKKLPKKIAEMKNLKKLGLEGNYIDKSIILKLKKQLPKCEIFW